MNNEKIVQFLHANGYSDIEEIKNPNGNGFLVRFFYDFDDEEIKAATAYSNDECEDEQEGEIWYEEFFMPYLSDIAVDNTGEIIEEIIENFDIDAQFISYDFDEEDYGYNEFIAIFFPKGEDVSLEDILESLQM